MLGDLSSVCAADPLLRASSNRHRTQGATKQQLVRWACLGLTLTVFVALLLFHWHWWQAASARASQRLSQDIRQSPIPSAALLPAHSNGFLDAADRDLVRKVRLQHPSQTDPLVAVQAVRRLQSATLSATEADWPHATASLSRQSNEAMASNHLQGAGIEIGNQLHQQDAANGAAAMHAGFSTSQGSWGSPERRLQQSGTSEDLAKELQEIARHERVSELPVDYSNLLNQASSVS